MQTYRISPLDLLFFRDGRPLDIDKACDDHRNIGHGAFWPRPDHLYNAVMHALIGSRTAGERAAYGQFGGVQTRGPYPLVKEDGNVILYLPRPLDWDCVIERLPEGDTDAPDFLEYGFIDRKPGKKSYPAWISLDAFKTYLKGGALPVLPSKTLFHVETRVGNTLDSGTGASKRVQDQHRSGQYEAQYLRLAKDVSMWADADSGKEGVSIPTVLNMGGQGLLVDFDRDDSLPSLEREVPRPEMKEGNGPFFVRWTLLAPAAKVGWISYVSRLCRGKPRCSLYRQAYRILRIRFRGRRQGHAARCSRRLMLCISVRHARGCKRACRPTPPPTSVRFRFSRLRYRRLLFRQT